MNKKVYNYLQSLSKTSHKTRKTFVRKHKRIHTLINTKEFILLITFGGFFGIIILQLAYLQIFKAGDYEQRMTELHYKEARLQAKRGHIYVTEKNGSPIQLTENIQVYDIYIEPQHLQNDTNKASLIDIITPYMYEHLCIQNGIDETTPEQCVQNIETFTNKNLLPEIPEFFYLGSGIVSEGYDTFDRTGHRQNYSGAVTRMDRITAERLIRQRLQDRITIGLRDYNYLGFVENPALLEKLDTLEYITSHNNYIYIIPNQVQRPTVATKILTTLFNDYGYSKLVPLISDQLQPKQHTYIKLAQEVHPAIANKLNKLKTVYKQGFYNCRRAEDPDQHCDKYLGYRSDQRKAVPLLHGLGLEPYTIRHYPYNTFLAHAIGYVNKAGAPTFGVEEYLHDQLRGTDGKIIGRSSVFVGDIGANEFNIQQPKDGNDLYLTINPSLQKETQSIADYYKDYFQADSVSIAILDPHNGYIQAHVNSPSFNPNNFNDAFRYQPVSTEHAQLIDDTSYVDVHLYVQDSDSTIRKATTDERVDSSIPKYMSQNIYSSEVFVDKLIKYAYEPGSIIKALTVGIGLDTDELTLYDFYQDKGFVKIGPYTIQNVSSKCLGEHNFLNALVYSCNVGMVRIVQRVGKEIFYNYIQKLGFGQKTNVELAGEEEGFVEPVSTVSVARFLNNSFGLGIKATPLQIASAYASLINGGYLMQPTIIDKTYDANQQTFLHNQPKVIKKVFKSQVSEEMKKALFETIEYNEFNKEKIGIAGFSIGGKSGTSEITFKGRYQTSGNGWTNASFVGLVTKENPKYVIIIQVRRPRTAKRGSDTAGLIFQRLAQFIINYELIPE